MVDLSWIGPVGAGAMCFGAGILAWMKAPKSPPAGMFLAAMTALLLATITASLYPIVGQNHEEVAIVIAKIFVMFALLTMALLWLLTLIFPLERKVSFRPLNLVGFVMVATVVLVITVGITAGIDYSNPASPEIDDRTSLIIVSISTTLAVMVTATALYSVAKTDAQGRKSAAYFLIGFGIGFVSAITWMMQVWDVGPMANLDENTANILITLGFAVSGLLNATAIAMGRMSMIVPVSEELVSSSKARYRLIHRFVYLVVEPKPDFAFKVFTDVLKGRCHDCDNDDSFPCESLDCASCTLPCPCKGCKKYKSRPQGLIVTRQYPHEVRAKYFLQTTPIIWLSSVAGNDNMDPAKLSLLTDNLVNFMEKSQNGVVLVDGLEYLATSNDFARLLKAADRWSETAMTSNSVLIMSIDARSFDPKELAIMERNREVVRPDAPKTWMIIPERI
jgi:hypothetical protein